ncbi:MAG: transcription antitermination protein NusB [Flavobacteriales bacterium]|nr:transcription antitermination protein NusB [Flavobacteriales bacterium]
MLNRRYLRIKVYQSLYAFWQSDSNSAARIEKELFLSIERTFDLFVSLLLTFGEFRRLAEQRIEDRKLKHLPSASDLSASRKFVDGPLITGIASSALLEAEANKRRLGWMGQMEMFQRILKQFESDPAYQCALVKRVLEGSRDAAAFDLAVVDVLRAPQEEHDFVSTLFRKCIEQGPEHEESIAEKAANWEADRIALSDMILMKMALTEVREFPEIPVKVTLNEYIEVAKAYSTPKSKNFINGILDKLFAEMKADGRIRKVGRGLLES